VLQGNLSEAATAVHERGGRAEGERALLCLAARKKGDQKLAEQQQQALLAALAKGDRDARRLGELLTAKQPPDVEEVRKLPHDAGDKRVLVALLAARHPDKAKELTALARRLNFQRDETALCLQKLLER
jgi:hypothetical protein